MMRELDEIIELLANAQQRAKAIRDENLAYHIGTALLVATERSLGQKPPPRRS